MKAKWPPHWIYYASIGYISAKTWSSALMKAYLWSTNNGNVSWTVNGVEDPGKVQNQPVAKSQIVLIPIILILVKTFIPRQLIHGYRYCFINNTNELRQHLLSKRKNQQEDKSVQKITVYGLELVCSYLCHNHYLTQMTGERHFT